METHTRWTVKAEAPKKHFFQIIKIKKLRSFQAEKEGARPEALVRRLSKAERKATQALMKSIGKSTDKSD